MEKIKEHPFIIGFSMGIIFLVGFHACVSKADFHAGPHGWTSAEDMSGSIERLENQEVVCYHYREYYGSSSAGALVCKFK